MRIDLTGQKFGRLTALFVCGARNSFAFWECKCDCGAIHRVRSASLIHGNTRSCGCLLSEASAARKLTHGLSKTPEYDVWADIHQRCSNPKRACYPRYGGRGIKVCRRWSTFAPFFRDMGPRPSHKHSIDRKDNDKGYTPRNCRWATQKEQARNKRTSRIVEMEGKSLCVAAWAEIYGINKAIVYNRIYRGWTNSDAITTPLGGRAA